MHVLSIRPQVENRIRDELSGAVIGDVAAAARLMDLHAARLQHVGRRDDVRSRRIALHTEREHVGMLEQDERVGNAIGAAVLDERLLQREAVGVGDRAEPPDRQLAHHRSVRYTHDASKSSSVCFSVARNWSAVAPSTRR